jgi:outer membrane protein TolC
MTLFANYRLGYALLVAGLTLATRSAFASESLAALVDTAIAQNPQLTAIEAQIAALEHKTTQAGAWQNPKLQVAYQNAPVDSFALGVEPMTQVMIRLEQTVPFFGKTSDREDVVRKATQAKKWDLEEKKNELRALVKTAYYRLALSRQLERITRDHIDLVLQLIDAVRIKYEVGKAAQQDLLRLEVLRDRLRDELRDFARQQRELTAAINTTLHRDVETPIETPKELVIEAPPRTLDDLSAIALASRPELKALASTAQMHRAAANLAEYEAIPDPTLFASYGIRTEIPSGNPGRDLVTLGIGLPLPIFYGSRNAARASESRELARANDARSAAVVDAIHGGLEDALAKWSRAADKVKTYRTKLVPDAHRTLDATFSSYQVDRADFLSLYDAELELLQFEKTIRIATTEGLVAETVIERLIGKTLTGSKVP